MIKKIKANNLDLKNMEEIKNYFIKEVDQSELMSKKHKKVCTILNYIEEFFILASAITECVSISALASLVTIPTIITSSAVGLKITATTATIRNYKSIINKKKKKHYKILLLANS